MAAPRPLSWPVWALILGLALGPRLLQAALRWDELALAYSAYPTPTVEDLGQGAWLSAATRWVGLHPPLWPLLFGISELLCPVPAIWLLSGSLLGCAAVAAVAREGGAVAGLCLAFSPLAVAYCAEVNNYPLAIALIALLPWAAQARWSWLLVVALLAGWTHLLAAAAAGGVVLWRLAQPGPARERWALGAGGVMGMAPVVLGAALRSQEGGTFAQPELEVGALWSALSEVAGPGWGLLGLAGLIGARGPAAAALWPLVGALLLSLALGAAAPHQHPYYALLCPLLALGLAQLAEGKGWAQALVLGLSLASAAPPTLAQLQVGRVLDAELEEPGLLAGVVERSREGDLLWLVSPALLPDDDKRASSAALWRFPPWSWMPRASAPDLDYLDWTQGQPRRWRGRLLATSTELEPGALDRAALPVLQSGGRLAVLLYDHGPATGLAERVERALRPYAAQRQEGPPRVLGAELLWWVELPP